MIVRIHTFASLKDHFEQEFTFDMGNLTTVEDLLGQLVIRQPRAASVLHACRTAVNEAFVSQKYVLRDGENIFLIPPSSGG